MTTKKAISDIITYNTLPPQIDYTLPYQLKSIEAQKWLEANLSSKEYDEANKKIQEEINAYSESGAAIYDAMF